MIQISDEMIDAGLELYEVTIDNDLPVTDRQMIEGIIRTAMESYVPPKPLPIEDNPPAPGRGRTNIYFISDGSSVKIGRANDVHSRLRALQVSHPTELKVLGIIRDYGGRERALHTLFAGDRVRGEWFNLTPEIKEYIKQSAKHLKNTKSVHPSGKMRLAV